MHRFIGSNMAFRFALAITAVLAGFSSILLAQQPARPSAGRVAPQAPVVPAVQIPPGVPRDLTPPSNTQRIPVGTGSIVGTVTAAATGRPIPGARVMVSGSIGTQTGTVVAPAPGSGRGGALMSVNRQAVADERGRFVIDALPAGQFTVLASASRYLGNNVVVRGRPQPPIVVRLNDGEERSLEIKLLRGGVIEGTVFGVDGVPSVQAQVRAHRFTYATGVLRLQQVGNAITDDRGAYRLFDLQPGEYVVSATPQLGDWMFVEQLAAQEAAFRAALAASPPATSARAGAQAFVIVQNPAPRQGGAVSGFVPTFAPSVTSVSDAMRIVVDPSSERSGVDIRTVPGRAASLSGIVEGIPQGFRVMVLIVSAGSALDADNVRSTSVDQAGAFVLANLTPGRYIVSAQLQPGPAQVQQAGGPIVPAPPAQLTPKDQRWARAEVMVDGNSTEKIVLTLREGRQISGTVVLQTSRPTGPPPRVTLQRSPLTAPTPSFGPPPVAEVAADGRFTFEGVVPGSYGFLFSRPLKSAMVDGRDALDEPLEFDASKDISGVVLTVAERATSLTGVLSGTTGDVLGQYSVVLASTDRRYWTPGSRRIQLARTGPNGRFTLANMPAGTYWLAALAAIEQGIQYDPAFLESLSAAAIRVTITEGLSHEQNVQVSH
jgi:hypothetical protein